jgi:hypothetical protein
VCDPRLRAFSVSNPKKRSTKFSHEAYVGVKWKCAVEWRSHHR